MHSLDGVTDIGSAIMLKNARRFEITRRSYALVPITRTLSPEWTVSFACNPGWGPDRQEIPAKEVPMIRVRTIPGEKPRTGVLGWLLIGLVLSCGVTSVAQA